MNPSTNPPPADSPSRGTVSRTVEVLNGAGLHARPASVLAACANEYESEISLVLAQAVGEGGVDVGTRVDAKSVLDVIVLGAPCGTKIDVEAVGPDAEAAVAAIEALFLARFGLM